MRQTDIQQSMDRGNVARRAGRLEEALTFYREAIVQAPEDAEANSLYGLVLLHMGKMAEAEPALRKAVEREPDHIGFRINLGELFERQGRIGEALAEFQAVAAQAPTFPRAWERLGDLTALAQQTDEAFRHYARAFALEPSNQAVGLKWAALAHESNRNKEARKILESTEKIRPDNPAIFPLYVKVLSALHDWGTLERLGVARSQSQPDDVAVWDALTTVAFETGRLREAMELSRRALDHAPRDAARLTAYAQHCLNVSEFAEAEAALNEAEAIDPQYTDMLSAKALLLTYFGRFPEAETYCRRALARDSEHAPAYRVLSQLKRGRLSCEERTILAALSRRHDLRIADRIPASFVLADCLDAVGRFDEAFAAYKYANDLSIERARADNLDYDRTKRVAWIDQLMSVFPALAEHTQADLGPRPIFIVGMPRSGTTLVESVLAAHSRVFGCGERTVMPQILLDFLLAAKQTGGATPPPQRWENWLRAYWYQLPDTGGADHITDKNPFNFEAAGLIVQLFPRAHIVHVRRNPIETGLSIYRNLFPKFVSFANRLEDIGHYYGEYARLVKHWERVLGGRFTTVQYEDFVGDFDKAAPALLAACGLRWEEACSSYDKLDRPVATLSAVQVRERVGAGDSRARQYQSHLSPLVNALNEAGVDMKTGALRTS